MADGRAARIAAIRERWEDTRPGGWRRNNLYIQNGMARLDIRSDLCEWAAVFEIEPLYQRLLDTDAVAIAHAPEDVAWLLAEVERLGEQITAMQALTDQEFPPDDGRLGTRP